MPEISKDAIAIFGYLLPGFLAAWVLYGLTSDVKPSQFERVIQALIFTFLVHTTVPGVQSVFEFLGRHTVAIRPWDSVANEFAKLCLALLLGVVIAIYTNNDTIHEWLRRRGLTTRTSFPSEWFGVLSKTLSYVILHLHDERRLFGWPKEWPNEPDKGHFFIMQPSWIKEDGSQTDLPDVHGILVNAKDVKWVEFVGKPLEVSHA